MFKVQKYKRTATPVSGSVSFNTDNLYGDLVAVCIKPLTATTKWHLKITDPDGFTAWESDTLETGELIDLGISATFGIVTGIYTCAISGATVDEAFIIRLDIRQYSKQG